MTVSQQLQHPGYLILSPAVEPGETPEQIVPGGIGGLTPPDPNNPAVSYARAYDTVVNADPGTAPAALEVSFVGPPPGFRWLVTRAAIGSTNGTWGECLVLVGDFDPENPFPHMVDSTHVPNTAIADESSPIYVPGGQALTFRFLSTGQEDGSDATANIQYIVESEK